MRLGSIEQDERMITMVKDVAFHLELMKIV